MKKIAVFIGGFITIVLLTVGVNLHAEKLKVNDKAPSFALNGIDGKKVSLSDYKGKYVILEWINHGCPFVKKHYNTHNMQTLQKEMVEKDVVWLSICSSAEGKQGHMSPKDWMDVNAKKGSNATAVLLDENGKVGKKYGAQTTPHMYIINPEGQLVYQGAIDDKPSTDKSDVQGAKNYIRAAMDELLSGKDVSVPQTKPYGCSVKY